MIAHYRLLNFTENDQRIEAPLPFLRWIHFFWFLSLYVVYVEINVFPIQNQHLPHNLRDTYSGTSQWCATTTTTTTTSTSFLPSRVRVESVEQNRLLVVGGDCYGSNANVRSVTSEHERPTLGYIIRSCRLNKVDSLQSISISIQNTCLNIPPTPSLVAFGK